MTMLPDGTYDAIVIDAEEAENADFRLELTITLGPQIGRVIALRAHHVDARRRSAGTSLNPLDLLGIPGVLIVRDGTPSFRPEVA
jgi:hypothetical protein